MGKIRRYLSEASPIFLILVLVVAMYVAGELGSHFFGKTYEKNCPNNQPSEYAVAEFKKMCESYEVITEEEYGVEYHVYYDNKNKAIGDFMSLAHLLNNKYANGRFRHIYFAGKERIFRCYDKDKNIIAMRVIRRRGWGETFYVINFYAEK